MLKIGVLNKLHLLIVIVFISCSGTGNSTNNSSQPKNSSLIVGKVGNQDITYSELIENYGSGGISSVEFTYKEISEFLPVYLDYKAKLLSAKDEGYFEDEKILEEYNVYAKQAAYAYWIENEIRPTMFSEFKSRFKKSMKSSHILIALDPNAPAEDTLEAYNKLIEARNKFLSGTSMSDLDKEYSSVQQGRSMGGDLPWFSAGSLVKPFEDALYKLEVGDISMPIRTQFGYHVIHLENTRNQEPARSTSHIFSSNNSDNAKLDSAFKKLENGADWNEIVFEYTDDDQSKSNGGKIGWINFNSRFHEAFVDSIMNFDAPIKYTSPFTSIYGTHIVKIDSVRTFSSVDAEDEYILSLLKQSSSYRESNPFVIRWIADKYKEKENKELLEETINYISTLDTSSLKFYELPSELSNQEVYSFNSKKYSNQSFFNYLKLNNRKLNIYNDIRNWYLDFQESIVDSQLINLTALNFPDFTNQIDKYKSGLVVYQINEDSVWSAATIDTTKLVQMYQQNPEQYTYNDRYFYYLITSSRDSSITKATNFVKIGNSPDSLIAKGISVGVISDSTGTYAGEPFDKLANMKIDSFSEIFEYNKRKAVFYLKKVLPAREMTYQEAFNKLVTEYQPIREENWLNNLRSTYNVQLFMDNLKKAYEAEHNYK